MADISISLSSVQNVKRVNIEGLGVLKIRKLGAGEDLDLSFKQRRINKLIEELGDISKSMSGLNVKKQSDIKNIDKLAKQAEKISDELADIKKSQFDIYRGQLSDDKGGVVVDVIMNTLSDQERAEIFNLAFGDRNPLETVETVKLDEDDKDE